MLFGFLVISRNEKSHPESNVLCGYVMWFLLRRNDKLCVILCVLYFAGLLPKPRDAQSDKRCVFLIFQRFFVISTEEKSPQVAPQAKSPIFVEFLAGICFTSRYRSCLVPRNDKLCVLYFVESLAGISRSSQWQTVRVILCGTSTPLSLTNVNTIFNF